MRDSKSSSVLVLLKQCRRLEQFFVQSGFRQTALLRLSLQNVKAFSLIDSAPCSAAAHCELRGETTSVPRKGGERTMMSLYVGSARIRDGNVEEYCRSIRFPCQLNNVSELLCYTHLNIDDAEFNL